LGEAEIGSFGRNLAYVARLEPGYSHLILPHPSQPEKWIVITDWVTGFRGREAQGAAAIPARELLANTLQFHQ
jgi:hypothetical protein